jgi:hypothetical protein
LPDQAAPPISIRDGALVAGLFAVAFWAYLASAGGHGYSLDGEMYFRVAEEVVTRGDISLESAPPGLLAPRGYDGRRYSKYAPGQSLAEMPMLAAFGPAYRGLTGLDASWETARAWVPTTTNAGFGALALVLLFLEARSLGAGRARALVVAASLGFATHLWWHARSDLGESSQAFLLLGLFASLRRVSAARGLAPIGWAIGCGLCLGGLVLAKATCLLLAPVVALAVLWRPRPIRPLAILRDLCLVGLPAAAGVAVYLVYNQARYGSPLSFGYDEPFDTPLLVGLYGWFLSSGKSVLLYAPPLVIAAVAAPRFWRERRRESALIVGLTAPLVVAYAMFWSWDGDFAWGPRFAVPLLGLWLLPLARLPGGRASGMALGVAIAAGVCVQVLGVAIDPARYLWEHSRQVTPRVHAGATGDQAYRLMLQDVHFVPEFSPVAAHWWLLRLTLDQSLPADSGSPGQRQALPPPWVTSRPRESWMPPNPERMAGLDVWAVSEAGRRLLVARPGVLLALLAPALVGGALIALALSPRSGQDR